MYSYEWDAQTGGLLLNSTILKLSKEPRPVYYKELDILGFDKYWDYEKDDSAPYMWAEANNYFYFGRKVARTKGGTLYTAPEIEILEEPEAGNAPLRRVDIPLMVEKNREIMEALTQETIKKVYTAYDKYKDKVDVFYVAFSGGKDSLVTLDIIQRALPHKDFKVLFGDTGMEFPDTYKAVKKVKEDCENKEIDFIVAKSDFSTDYTWRQFGPPATVNRWCCSVHKTAPQIIALRNITGKSNFTGMAFIGVRASESLSRNDYDYISLGEKHKGQYSCNPILDWNSAELYTYIYSENIELNEAYKKGNSRAGCLVCPNVSEKNSYFRRINYRNFVDEYIDIIKDFYRPNIIDEKNLINFVDKSNWKLRKNGRDISSKIGYSEKTKGNYFIVEVRNPKTDWKVWIKTIGVLLNVKSPYIIDYKNKQYTFEIEPKKNGYDVHISNYDIKYNAIFTKYLKNVFKKATCCIGCRECEADCPYGNLSFKEGKLYISDNCIHCAQCHKADKACLVYKSLELPKGGSNIEKKKSLNCYSTHAPKIEWIEQFFKFKNDFNTNNSLGSQMVSFFSRFLRDSDLVENAKFSNFAEHIENIGLENDSSWALMLSNLVYSPQINWYIKNINLNEECFKDYLVEKLKEDGANDRASRDIIRSFNRFAELPFSNVGFGFSTKEKNKVISFTRTPWRNPDPKVILYSLYKFAEACKDYYQFTLTRLMDFDVDSDGVSPAQIFGIEKDDLGKIIRGLSLNYPDFITSSFSLDLDNVNLNKEKTSQDVLSLFE